MIENSQNILKNLDFQFLSGEEPENIFDRKLFLYTRENFGLAMSPKRIIFLWFIFQDMVMRQFGPNTKFGPEADLD